MKNDLNTIVEEELDKFDALSEDEQLAKQAEYVGQLIEMLPDPENQAEINEFVELYNSASSYAVGDTDEEKLQNFLKFCEEHQKFFQQCVAMSFLSADLTTVADLAKETAAQKTSVESISASELAAIKSEDTAAEVEQTRQLLESIPIDDVK